MRFELQPSFGAAPVSASERAEWPKSWRTEPSGNDCEISLTASSLSTPTTVSGQGRLDGSSPWLT